MSACIYHVMLFSSVKCYSPAERREIFLNQIKTGQILKEMHQKKGNTQKQLAKFLCVSNRGILRWEHGVSHS